MEVILFPTLENLSVSVVVSKLWMQQNFLKDICCLLSVSDIPVGDFNMHPNKYSHMTNEWLKIKRKVLDQITQLHLPEYLKDKLEDLVHYTGLEIRIWIQQCMHLLKDKSILGVIELIQWSPRGSIDYKKTASAILETNNVLSAKNRFLLACNNCLEHQTRTTWEMLTITEKQNLYDIYGGNIGYNIVSYWMDRITGQRTSRNISNHKRIKNLLRASWEETNYEAFKYYFEELNEEGKRNKFVKIMKLFLNEKNNFHQREIVIYLLSQMNHDEAVNMTPYYGIMLRLWFQEWMYHNRIVFDVDMIWNFMTENDFKSFLKYILSWLQLCFPSKYYEKGRKLFIQLWKYHIPSQLKRCALNDGLFFTLLCLDPIIRILNVEFLELMLGDATAQDKWIISIVSKSYLSYLLLSEYMSQIIKNLVTKVSLCEQQIQEFRSDFQKAFDSDGKDETEFPLLNVLRKWSSTEKYVNTKIYDLVLFYEDIIESSAFQNVLA